MQKSLARPHLIRVMYLSKDSKSYTSVTWHSAVMHVKHRDRKRNESNGYVRERGQNVISVFTIVL